MISVSSLCHLLRHYVSCWHNMLFSLGVVIAVRYGMPDLYGSHRRDGRQRDEYRLWSGRLGYLSAAVRAMPRRLPLGVLAKVVPRGHRLPHVSLLPVCGPLGAHWAGM